ncbi:MAG: leucyl aminopeptidase [Bacillota bacterium]|jgi:leucyl aminopeptidase
MQVRVINQAVQDVRADVLIVNLFSGVTEPGGATGAVDQATGGLLRRLIEQGELTGKLNETLVLYPDGLNVRKLVVVGLGEAEKFTAERVRQVAATALKAARRGKVETVATIVHGAGSGGLCPVVAAQVVVEGSLLAVYRHEALKSKKSEEKLRELLLVEQDAAKIEAIEKGVRKGTIMAEATNLARDLVNTPANYMTPTHMAEAAQKLAAETGLTCEILEREDMERLGMGCLLGVAQGSQQPPKMIVLRHEGNPGGKWLGLVGKGITFDSGGISLKPGAGMDRMKGDMAGAAAVMGAMHAIGHLKPRANVLAVMACTENLPSGVALKPGDVIRAMTGKTVEIMSTDAEGRLVLADAVAYAEHLGAEQIVDIATLTGAVGRALGNIQAGIVSDSDCLVAEVQAAAALTGERYWRFPHDEEYREGYKSPVADIRNGGGGAGTIVGGLIIREFIKDAAWVHLDVAAMTMTDTERGYQVKGATGFGTRTLVELALRMEAK